MNTTNNPYQWTDVVPLHAAFGHAVYEGQHLEGALRLLFRLIAKRHNVGGKRRPHLQIDSPDAPKMMRELLESLERVVHFTAAERRIIIKGIRTRNFLVHAYWSGDRVTATTTRDGRAWLLEDLDQKREECRQAGRLVDKFIDDELAAWGTSLEEASTPLLETYEGGSKVPKRLLQ